jgi:GST-like protein
MKLRHGGDAMIELHSYPTANGLKVMVLLEELGLAWRHVDVNIRLGEQFSAAHLRLSPNNKIPALVDPDGPGGRPMALMESNAILVYLAEKHGAFLAREPAGRYDALQWLLFQSSHVGPMIGQANHFNNHSDVQYGKDRYNREVARLYRVIDNRLAEQPWMGGSEYGIADIALHPWCRTRQHVAVDPGSHPNFFRWFDAIEARAAVHRAYAQGKEIRARMDQASSAGAMIDLYNTADNLARLSGATARAV